MSIKESFREGRLDEAISTAVAEVKRNPGSVQGRSQLCELLCLAGELERADMHLDIIAQQDHSAAVGALLYRQLIRAEQARRDFFERGRPPELITELTPPLRRRLEAALAIREGKDGDAAKMLAEINEPESFDGEVDGESFSDFRDLDDLIGTVFELLLPDGRYVWLPMNAVESVTFHRPAHVMEFLWRRITISIDPASVLDGPNTGDVYLPALYHGTHAHEDPQVRLGRATAWRETPAGQDKTFVRGAGQRMFLVGEEARDMTEMEEVKFKSTKEVQA